MKVFRRKFSGVGAGRDSGSARAVWFMDIGMEIEMQG